MPLPTLTIIPYFTADWRANFPDLSDGTQGTELEVTAQYT